MFPPGQNSPPPAALPPSAGGAAPPPSALPAMNAAANANSSGADCQPKSWFAISIYKVDEKDKETYAEGVTIDLQIPELGPIQRITI